MKMAQSQALVTVQGIPGNWATRTGGETTSDTTPVWDGGELYPDILAAPPQVGNVTISRPVDDDRDLTELKRLRKLVGKLRTTVTEQPTDGDLFPIGDPTVYPGALLVRAAGGDYDAASGDPRRIELEWATPRVV